MSDHSAIDAEIALTVAFLRAHPEADLEAVLRRFAAFVLRVSALERRGWGPAMEPRG